MFEVDVKNMTEQQQQQGRGTSSDLDWPSKKSMYTFMPTCKTFEKVLMDLIRPNV